jgi:predicted nucleic acid-binding protein
MTRYVVDTTFVVDYLRNVPAAVQRYNGLFEHADDVLVNEIVVCEAATGSPAHPDPALMAFLEPLEFVQPGPDVPLRAGEWRAAARARGHSLSLADALIAAAAEAANASVLTRNVRDFALTPARVESY